MVPAFLLYSRWITLKTSRYTRRSPSSLFIRLHHSPRCVPLQRAAPNPKREGRPLPSTFRSPEIGADQSPERMETKKRSGGGKHGRHETANVDRPQADRRLRTLRTIVDIVSGQFMSHLSFEDMSVIVYCLGNIYIFIYFCPCVYICMCVGVLCMCVCVYV